jgi:transposase
MAAKGDYRRWTADDDDRLRVVLLGRTYREAAKLLGLRYAQVKNRARRIGIEAPPFSVPGRGARLVRWLGVLSRPCRVADAARAMRVSEASVYSAARRLRAAGFDVPGPAGWGRR